MGSAFGGVFQRRSLSRTNLVRSFIASVAFQRMPPTVAATPTHLSTISVGDERVGSHHTGDELALVLANPEKEAHDEARADAAHDLAAILDLVAATDGCAEAVRRRWAAALDRSDTDRIYTAITWNTRLPPHLAKHIRSRVRGDKTAELSRHIEYVRNNRRRMRYATPARRGFPIGSGVTEGACKSVITTRCKRSGQRWRERGLSACLALRSQHLNERLRPCFAQVQTSYIREVRPA